MQHLTVICRMCGSGEGLFMSNCSCLHLQHLPVVLAGMHDEGAAQVLVVHAALACICSTCPWFWQGCTMKGQLRCRLFMQHLPVIDRMQDEWAVQGRGLLMQHWLVIWQDTGGRSDFGLSTQHYAGCKWRGRLASSLIDAALAYICSIHL
jgi:hypothetical protein